MLPFPGYTIIERLHEGASFAIYRCCLDDDDRSRRIIKTHARDVPTARELASLRHEHAILSDLRGPGVVPVYSLHTYGTRLALVMDDVGLQSLDRLSGARLDIGNVLNIIKEVLSVLERAHRSCIVHRDIKPHNILVGTAPPRVYLIDWGIACRLTEVLISQDGGATPVAGTPAYLAPEQTGVLSRSVDTRTDLYSLGVTFYELLTGVVPFNDEDPAELVRSHLTRMPTPPHEVEPRVPLQVSAIVMKLLAKDADDRYGSARGLAHDVSTCLEQWEQNRQIGCFPLGQADSYGSIRIPQKLYGREGDLAAVSAAFERCRQGAAELLLVTGYGGIGKSALVYEARGMMQLRGARIITGKFEQIGDPKPYASLVQAFRDLTRQLMVERADALARWREHLQRALGQNACVLTQIVPELESLLGPQPPPPHVGPAQAEALFHYALRLFISVFARPQHPLVLFMDDLQWADAVSLRLLKLLLTDLEGGALLIIGAYRDQDDRAIQLLMRVVESIAEAGTVVTRIFLRPLQVPDVTRLLADTLHTTPEQVESLSEEIHRKTNGNPFFLGQLVHSFAQDKLIHFDESSKAWTWDLRAIAQRMVTDNVAEFMAQRLQRLNPATQKLLSVAAALGTQFDHDMLAELAKRSISQCAHELWEALEEGLLVPLHDDYRLLRDIADTPRADAGEGGLGQSVAYRFLHDRVQEAAYSLLEERDRPDVHLAIARLLQSRRGTNIEDDDAFIIANHLNTGRALLRGSEARIAAAEQNLRAGRRAKRSVAISAARAYMAAGLEYLPEQGDEAGGHAELAFTLRFEHAELVLLDGDLREAEARIEELVARSRSMVQRGAAQALLIELCMASDRNKDALQLGRSALADLGAPLPETDEECKAVLDADMQRVIASLSERTIRELLDAPLANDPRLKLIAKLLVLSDIPAGSSPDLSALISCRQVLLSLEHGATELSAYGFASCALVMIRMSGRAEHIEQMVQLADAYQRRHGSAAYASRVNYLLASAHAAFSPTAEAVKHFERAAEVSFQHGDLNFLQYAMMNVIALRVFGGDEDLASVEKAGELIKARLQRLRSEAASTFVEVCMLGIASLREPTRRPASFGDDCLGDDALMGRIQAKNQSIVFSAYWALRLMLSYIYAEHDAAIPLLEERVSRMGFMTRRVRAPTLFYICLHLCAIIERASTLEAERYSAMLEECHAILVECSSLCEREWQCPMLLVAAGRARICGRDMEAQKLYCEAIDLAQTEGRMRLFALGSELYGRFSLKMGLSTTARLHLSHAYEGWLGWGANAKADALAVEFPWLVTMSTQEPTDKRPSSTGRSTVILKGVLIDLKDAMRAAHSISSEMVSERVVERLLRAACATVAARKVVVIMVRDGEQSIVGTLTVNPEVLRTSQGASLAETTEMAESVIRYVANSREMVSLSSSEPNEIFRDDPYLRGHRQMSLVCLPLINHDRLVGILYAECGTAGGLRQGIIELLQMLAIQAASALENARLYHELQLAMKDALTTNERLESEVMSRTADLASANQQLRLELEERARGERERMALQEQIIRIQEETLLELSTPLIPINDHILAMPLIGMIGEKRARRIVETVLSGVHERGASVLIIDLTGLRQVDSSIVRLPFDMAAALRLIGAQVILTGLDAKVARIFAELHVSTKGIVIKSTLQAGITFAMNNRYSSKRPSKLT